MLVLGNVAPASASPSDVWFPVQVDDQVNWSDTFGAPRSGGRTHKGVDIMAPQMQPIYASMGGWIRRAYGGDSRDCLDGGVCSSYGFLIYGDDGRSYFYLHLNNDRPGRPNGCDQAGGADNAFSPRLVDVLRQRGTLEPLPNSWDAGDVVRVETGELIGYVGSSGNAGCKVDHLHFETWAGHDFRSANDPGKDNPYPIVQAAYEAGRYWDALGPIEPVATRRLSGADRIATSVAISKDGFASAKVAVIAPAEVYPEALVGGPLAAALHGPVLLHWGQVQDGQSVKIAPVLVDELARLGVTEVVVMSGGNAMDARFEDALAAATGIARDHITRFAAADRYELSARVAEELLAHHGWTTDTKAESEPNLLSSILGENDEEPQAKRATISPILALGEHPVEGRGWPDALAAATLAASQQVPILLTRPNELPAATAEILGRDGFGEVRIVGGTGAISAEVEQAVKELDHDTRRLSGKDRYATALAVVGELVELGHSIDSIYVATGESFPDAMAAAASVASQGRILLLLDGDTVDGAPQVLEWLRANKADVDELTALGGQKAIANDVLRTAAINANWPTDG